MFQNTVSVKYNYRRFAMILYILHVICLVNVIYLKLKRRKIYLVVCFIVGYIVVLPFQI